MCVCAPVFGGGSRCDVVRAKVCVLNTSDFLNSTREATTLMKAVQVRLKEALTAPDADYAGDAAPDGTAAVSTKLIDAVRACVMCACGAHCKREFLRRLRHCVMSRVRAAAAARPSWLTRRGAVLKALRDIGGLPRSALLRLHELVTLLTREVCALLTRVMRGCACERGGGRCGCVRAAFRQACDGTEGHR